MSFDTLIKAVRAGKVEEVRAELSKCDDPTSLLEQFTKETCMTPLMLAASKGHVKVMELLVKKGAKLDTMSHADTYSDKSVSALMTAACRNQVEAVKTLIRLGADVNLQNKNGSSALLLACMCKSINTEIINVLLSNGAICNPRGRSLKSPLRAVIDNDNVDIAKILLEYGATVCMSDLYEACCKEKGNFTMVEALLQSCSTDEINKLPVDWWSPLMVASSRGHDDIVELLLRHGADIDAESSDHKYALLLAIKKGHVSTVKLLLQKKAKVKNSITDAVNLISMKPRDIRECSMLPESVVLSIVKLLIDHGADVDCEDSTQTPLLIAISKESLKVVKLLVENGADVNLLAGAESGPLKMAVERNQIKIAQLLLDKGADVNLKNVSDVTPLMVASTPAMASLLVKHGAKLDEVDNRGKSALLRMVDRSRGECFEVSDMLLEEGADSNLSDDDGRCPASIIKEKYDRLGLNAGGDISVLAMNKKLVAMEAQRPRREYMEQMMRGKEILDQRDPLWFDRQHFASRHGAVLANFFHPPPANVTPTPSTSQILQPIITSQPSLDVPMMGNPSVTNPQKKRGLEVIDGGEGSSSSPPTSKKPKRGSSDSPPASKKPKRGSSDVDSPPVRKKPKRGSSDSPPASKKPKRGSSDSPPVRKKPKRGSSDSQHASKKGNRADESKKPEKKSSNRSKRPKKYTPDGHEKPAASNESPATLPEFGLKNVLKFLRKHLSTKDYLKLALELGLTMNNYEEIDSENPKNSHNVLAGIINLWIKNSVKPKASWELLKKALLEVQPTLAHKISTPCI